MLSELYINHVAVISEATIGFAPGLNVFTGETGAGKTILISAINAVLGERASKEMIRTGEQKAAISALFTDLDEHALSALTEAGYEDDEGAVLIAREITADGKSSCKINGRPATASILKSVTAQLINVHGQHDNQQLLSPGRHLGFVDSFGETAPLLARYAGAYHAYMQVKRELETLQTDEAEKARKMDLLRYQIEEIEAAELRPDEEDELRAQRKQIKHALHITDALGASVELLDGDEESRGLSEIFSGLMVQMQEAAKFMETAEPIAERITDLYYEMEGLGSDIHELLENFDCDPSRLDEIERRLDVIYNLKKKYGSDLTEVLAYRDRALEELSGIEHADERAEQLRGELDNLREQAEQLAKSLSAAREQAANGFVNAVMAELAFLDMPSVRLSVQRQQKPLSPDGIDELELFLATNVGEEAKSLAKIASGGELARIMLSIKNVLADRDGIGTLIFDEVDTGVSGRAAQKIGQKLSQVSQNRQVIVVTHLAQVASYAKRHLYISKQTHENRTFTTIQPLEREERVRELARIVGGEKISEIALSHAREMLADAES